MNRFFTLLLAASCLTAVGQSEYCLDGTVWDEALQGCVPESVACEVEFDYDGDGTVGSGDLLAFLTAFGASFPDEDADGVCDEIDECVGEYDECGVCNGPGAVYDCGCDECNLFEQCGDLISYQGYDYQTVQIGEQCWFAENLRAENYRNGDPVPSMNPSASGLLEINDVFYYQWEVVNDLRGICPSGWQVPSVLDYEGLPLGGSLVSHQYSSYWNGYIPCCVGQVSSAGLGEVSWTRQEWELDSSQAWRFSDSDDGSELGWNPKDNGETIRCIKDSE